MKKIKGIIFDMDNTLLKSNINFSAMKAEVFEFLVAQSLLPEDFPIHDHTTSMALEAAKLSRNYAVELGKTALEICTRHEVAGMEDAVLEHGACEVLEALQGNYCLTVLTNNSFRAAMHALRRNSADGYFQHIAGREQVPSLKPDSSGVLYMLNRFGHIPPREWISIGDSWTDGAAATGAGVDFIAYNSDNDIMTSRGVYPIASISRLEELLPLLEGI